MLVAHRIELIINNTERTYLSKCCGCARLTWNWALAEWERQYKVAEKPNVLAIKKQFNAVKYQLFPFLGEISQYPISQAFFDLRQAWSNFFRSVKAKDGQFRKLSSRASAAGQALTSRTRRSRSRARRSISRSSAGWAYARSCASLVR